MLPDPVRTPMHQPATWLLPITPPAVLLATAGLRHLWQATDTATRHGTGRPGGVAKRLDASDGGVPSLLEFELVPAWTLRAGDLVACWTGDVVTGSAVAIAGSAVVTSSERLSIPRRVMAEGTHVAAGTRIVEGYLLLRLEDAASPGPPRTGPGDAAPGDRNRGRARATASAIARFIARTMRLTACPRAGAGAARGGRRLTAEDSIARTSGGYANRRRMLRPADLHG